MPQFYSEPFDEATRTKLELFRQYIRAWISIFLTHWGASHEAPDQINIFDLFAGQGRDLNGVFGSALIIVEEIRAYCNRYFERKSSAPVSLFFNDLDAEYIANLKEHVERLRCPKRCCQPEYTQLPFKGALEHYLPLMQRSHTANLVIMDQFGYKEVTPEVVARLASCSMTDILFFIASSFVHRFCATPEIQKRFAINPEDMQGIEYPAIHRYLCEYFRDNLGSQTYYLAPYSLKKGSNIYGVIFGTRHPLGLEKYLDACWKLDGVTGEANYNIDGDLAWDGQLALWPGENVPKKVDLFKRELQSFVREKSPDNRELYLFCLTRGFSGSRARQVVEEMVNLGIIQTGAIPSVSPGKRGALYLNYTADKKEPKVRFRVSDEQ